MPVKEREKNVVANQCESFDFTSLWPSVRQEKKDMHIN